MGKMNVKVKRSVSVLSSGFVQVVARPSVQLLEKIGEYGFFLLGLPRQ